MKLSDQDKRMLEGECGPALQEAMEFLVKFGEAFEAEEMADLHRAHLFADYHTIGMASEIYTHFAELDAKVRVPTTDEPISMDPEHPEDFRLPKDYPGRQAHLRGRDGRDGDGGGVRAGDDQGDQVTAGDCGRRPW